MPFSVSWKSTHKLWLAVSILGLICLAACAADRAGGKVELANTGNANLHAVSDERLRVIMQELKSLTIDRFDSALEIEKQQARYFRKWAEVAEAVGKSARRIPQTGAAGEMTPGQRAEFLGFAQRLVDQAAQMKRLADSGDGRTLRLQMRSMITTCNSCHDRFRNMPREKR